ncbi:hypothetical protein [Sphingomicrobium nitratireducens]|uniref:hypothetical protein n=1 Tax=Sphingomicrobium nitratireducens TaxID=2964666 RepID=UPI00223EF73F|nr:hypothetical protein [Sphingomicrobium nitratireducens]
MRMPAAAIAVLGLAACGTPGLAPAPAFQPMTYAEFADLLPAGTGCAFESPKDSVLFVATAAPTPTSVAKGAYKLNGSVSVVDGSRMGGFEALRRGMAFTGREMPIVISAAGSRGAMSETGIETQIAELTVPGSKPVLGVWRCGS